MVGKERREGVEVATKQRILKSWPGDRGAGCGKDPL